LFFSSNSSFSQSGSVNSLTLLGRGRGCLLVLFCVFKRFSVVLRRLEETGELILGGDKGEGLRCESQGSLLVIQPLKIR